MSSRNVRFAPKDGSVPHPSARKEQAQYNPTAYLSQSPPRPSDITFARGDLETTMLHHLSHQRTPSDSASSVSDGSDNSQASSSPEQDFIPLIKLDECLEGLPSGTSRPFDCDLSQDKPLSRIPLHMQSRPACDPPVKYMHIDMGVTAVEVYVGNPSLGYVSVGDVIGALSASLRRPLPRDRWESHHLEFVDARRKRLGKAEPSGVLLIDMLGYDHFFHGLQDGPEGTWQVIFGSKKV